MIAPCPGPIDLTVARGEAVVIVDPQGQAAGRLIDLVCLGRAPRQGRIELFGQDLRSVAAADLPDLRRRLGLMFGDLRLADSLGVFDNLALAARAIGREPRDYGQPADELLAWVGLAQARDEPAAALDEAGRRRLALARALINRPDLLIVDEPAGGLAGEARRGVLKLVADLHAAGTAVLMLSRDESLAARSGANVVRLGAQPDAPSPANPA
jgi:cell division transport system ATP-binding protein